MRRLRTASTESQMRASSARSLELTSTPPPIGQLKPSRGTCGKYGGGLNAGTIYDSTNYYVIVPRENFAKGVEIQADAIKPGSRIVVCDDLLAPSPVFASQPHAPRCSIFSRIVSESDTI